MCLQSTPDGGVYSILRMIRGHNDAEMATRCTSVDCNVCIHCLHGRVARRSLLSPQYNDRGGLRNGAKIVGPNNFHLTSHSVSHVIWVIDRRLTLVCYLRRSSTATARLTSLSLPVSGRSDRGRRTRLSSRPPVILNVSLKLPSLATPALVIQKIFSKKPWLI